jgi:hypothetical protein
MSVLLRSPTVGDQPLPTTSLEHACLTKNSTSVAIPSLCFPSADRTGPGPCVIVDSTLLVSEVERGRRLRGFLQLWHGREDDRDREQVNRSRTRSSRRSRLGGDNRPCFMKHKRLRDCERQRRSAPTACPSCPHVGTHLLLLCATLSRCCRQQ